MNERPGNSSVPRQREEMSVAELATRCNEAASKMSRDNPNRVLLLNAGRAAIELATRLELERQMVGDVIQKALAVVEHVHLPSVDELHKAMQTLVVVGGNHGPAN